ncbi:MAG: hypothetical protein MR598_03120 [Erysipelotrichaceae bacterium]|nr:hypothetical protein [Erysipelotrichaceae bacterium]
MNQRFEQLYLKFKRGNIDSEEEKELMELVKREHEIEIERENKLMILKIGIFVLGFLLGMVIINLK